MLQHTLTFDNDNGTGAGQIGLAMHQLEESICPLITGARERRVLWIVIQRSKRGELRSKGFTPLLSASR
jgi:hypothetical protein